MSNELMVGVELFFAGLIMVFAVLFIFKLIMDLMTVIANKPPRGAPLSLSEEELAAVMAVITERIPGSSEANVRICPIETRN